MVQIDASALLDANSISCRRETRRSHWSRGEQSIKLRIFLRDAKQLHARPENNNIFQLLMKVGGRVGTLIKGDPRRYHGRVLVLLLESGSWIVERRVLGWQRTDYRNILVIKEYIFRQSFILSASIIKHLERINPDYHANFLLRCLMAIYSWNAKDWSNQDLVRAWSNPQLY